ncbi:zinc finger MYM-type protein 1-like [Helianthus annuus]|uniref:zinc finger MYM-type protein 1-like n=1 Tax=Helianthus annuus TaxID=4232 RepID=UPI000B8F9650|nr:zinc finger MYM-type protein 1-like [Helianthus annuus]
MSKEFLDRFLKRKSTNFDSSTSNSKPSKIDLDDLPWDPSERKPISSYHPDQKDEVRRAYLAKGPCQPKSHDFPVRNLSDEDRRFSVKWFESYPTWLEYSEKTDRVYCLFCYLFKEPGQKETFVSEGYYYWNKKDRLKTHVGDNNSFHNKAVKKCEDLLRQDRSIQFSYEKYTDKQKSEYRIRLHSTIIVSKALLNGSLPFRGHDESEKSLYKGHFLELLKLLGEVNESIRKVILENAPKNSQMTSPQIQKEVINCFAQEVLKQIFEELDDDVFSILVDESRDCSKKEQMAVVLRYVDKLGVVKERFVGLVHVKETTSLSLKYAIDELFSKYNLSLTKVRGQGYDGASNMAGEFNGLKALILKENSSAYFVHCFAHQLQLVVVALANKHDDIWKFFEEVSNLTNVVCASCKRIDMIRESQKDKLKEAIGREEVETGSGLNQELSLARAGDTRWSSHYKTLVRLVQLYPTIIEVLEYIRSSGQINVQQRQANGIWKYMKSYDFAYYLHLMKHVLGVTNTLSQALQRKDQDIVNAVEMVNATKQQLQTFRLEGFDSLVKDVASFCDKNEIEMVDMDAEYIDPKYRRRKTNITNRHFYEVENFNTVLDMQIQEIGNRFSEILRLAEMYPHDFNYEERDYLMNELDIYINNIRGDKRFANVKDISNLATMMVETNKHVGYPLVYRLLKLSLVLPVATTSVERCFSAMKHVKTDLRNRMGDEYLTDACICYIEKEFFAKVAIEDVMNRFQNMKTRREQL